MRTVHDIPLFSLFRYNYEIYRLIDLSKEDQATVVCIARFTSYGWRMVSNAHYENFNPYASIIPGELNLTFNETFPSSTPCDNPPHHEKTA